MFKKAIRKIAKFVLLEQPKQKVNINAAQINYGNILKGKNILITGGTSGIGFSIAKKCLSEGANVIITGRSKEKIDKALNELGENCKGIMFDITDVKNDSKFLNECCNIFKGSIDCLINNAGISLHEGNFMNVTVDSYDKQFDTNLKGTYFLSKAFLEMKTKEDNTDANILMITSESADQFYDTPYGMTKNLLNELTQSLSKRVYKKGIRVNAISPGVTKTKMTDEYTNISKDNNLYRNNSAGRVFLPDEIAEVACFLLSDASKCISGEIIHCNAANHIKGFWEDTID